MRRLFSLLLSAALLAALAACGAEPAPPAASEAPEGADGAGEYAIERLVIGHHGGHRERREGRVLL